MPEQRTDLRGKSRPSIEVLREAGRPLTLREVTRQTAARMGVDQRYEDVDAVLRVAADEGLVQRVLPGSYDYTMDAWEATAAPQCGCIMVGSGGDTYDPICELPTAHAGPCKSSSAIDQHRLSGGR